MFRIEIRAVEYDPMTDRPADEIRVFSCHEYPVNSAEECVDPINTLVELMRDGLGYEETNFSLDKET